MRRRRRLLAVVLVGLVPALLAGCGATTSGGSGTRFVDGDSTVTLVPLDRREEPVALAGETLDGEQLDVAALRGSPVVLNVWGSWCQPCRKEAPALVAAEKRLAPSGTRFVGINIREPDPALARAFERRFEITYPSLRDDGGRLLLALRGAVPPQAVPTTLVLDVQGRIAARVNGIVSEKTLVDIVTDVSAE